MTAAWSESPPFCARGMRDGARAGHDDGFFWNDERLGLGGCVDLVADEIVNGDGAIEDRSRAKNSTALHDGTFINAGISAHQDFVFDNHRQRADRLKDAADLGACGNVAVAADLGATPNERMRIDHRAFTNVSTDIDEHRWHADHATADITSIANAGTAGNDAHAVGEEVKRANGISGLIEEGLLRGVDGHCRR